VRDFIFLQNLCFTISITGERERERGKERESERDFLNLLLKNLYFTTNRRDG